MRLIPLTKGFFAQVDDEDYDRVIAFAPNGWEAKYTTSSNNPYAITRKTIDLNGGRVRKQYYMHRLVMNVLDEPTKHIDHKKDTLDNTKQNLRIATRIENMKNRASAKNSTSKHLGVCYCKEKKGKKKWRAIITPSYSANIHLGYYDNEDSAGYAYNLAAKIIHKEFANLNSIDTVDDADKIAIYVQSVILEKCNEIDERIKTKLLAQRIEHLLRLAGILIPEIDTLEKLYEDAVAVGHNSAEFHKKRASALVNFISVLRDTEKEVKV